MIVYLPYIIVFLLLLIAVILETLPFPKNQKNWVKGFVLLVIVLFVGLRYNTGSDWAMYINGFENMPSQGNFMNWEIGYYFLSNLFSYVFHNYYVLQFFATAFLLFSLNRMFSRYSEYPIFLICISFLMFFHSIFMCQVRQSIALAIVVLSTPYIVDRKFPHFLAMVFLASMFHISACMTIVLYFLVGKWNRGLCIVLVLLGQFLPVLSLPLLHFIENIAHYIPGRLEILVHTYIGTIFTTKVEYNTGLYYLLTVVVGIATLFLIKPNNKASHFFYNSLVVSLLIMATSNGISIMNRFLPYFYVFGMISFAYLLSLPITYLKQISTHFIIALFFIVYFSLPSIGLLSSTKIWEVSKRPQNYGYVPYYNVLRHPVEADKRLDWNQN